MRKISRMYGVILLLPICFSGGYFSSFFKLYSEAVVAPPPPCSRWVCKNVYAVWVADSTVAGAFFDSANNPEAYAYQNVYARTNTTDDLPIYKYLTIPISLKTYTTCNPICGIDPATNNWQAPQEVSIPNGAVAKINVPFGNLQQCLGGPGVISNTPNTNTSIPPGWKQ